MAQDRLPALLAAADRSGTLVQEAKELFLWISVDKRTLPML